MNPDQAADQPAATPAPSVPAPAVPPKQRAPHRGHESGMMSSIGSLAVTIVIAVFVITFIVQAFQIPSESMENTLLIGDYLLVDKVQYGDGGFWGPMLPYRAIQRGDIIVFRYPVHPDQHFVKRVIGVPGDHVRLRHKLVWVNGRQLGESYVIHKSGNYDAYRDDFPYVRFVPPQVTSRWWVQMNKLVENHELIVPEGYYFVMGDNRDESLDSRYWGFVPRENVIGRPLLIYWSMRQPDPDDAAAYSGDKLSRLAYVLRNPSQLARWERTFRLVK